LVVYASGFPAAEGTPEECVSEAIAQPRELAGLTQQTVDGAAAAEKVVAVFPEGPYCAPVGE
jgi:hypothetical protein